MNNRCHMPMAIAYIEGNENAPELSGTIRFYQQPDGTLVVAEIYGLPPISSSGFFAFHIHEGGGCTGENFAQTGGHYNPGNTQHPSHAGDLPPLLSNHGSAYMAVLTDRFRAAEVIGKTVVIHSNPDDFHSQPAGNPGTKIACGIIQRSRK